MTGTWLLHAGHSAHHKAGIASACHCTKLLHAPGSGGALEASDCPFYLRLTVLPPRGERRGGRSRACP